MNKKVAKKATRAPRQIAVVEGDGETRKVSDLKPHPYAKKVLGMPTAQERAEMVADLKEKGQRTPIDILPDGTILDGLTRWMSAEEAGITELRVVVHDLDETAAKKFILKANLLRHYDKLMLARIFFEMKLLLKGDGGKAAKTGEGDLRDRLAKRFHISGRTLDRHVKMLKTPAEAHRLYRENVLSDSVMVALASLTSDQQKAVLEAVKNASDVKQKNTAAKTVISKFRQANKDKRAKAKAAENAKTTTKAKGNASTPASETAAPTAVTVPDDDIEQEVDADHDERVDGDGAIEAEETGVDAADEDDIEIYRRILNELPDTLDDLVQKIDVIVGQAMDPAEAIAALHRITASIAALREHEEVLGECD